MMEINCFDIIIAYLKASKEKSLVYGEVNGKRYALSPNNNYMLTQILRQYELPKSHIFVSKRAKEEWGRLLDENIIDYNYKQKVENIGKEYRYKPWKGNKNKPEEEEIILPNGKKFCFNDVFHFDHIVPIRVIIEQLKEIQDLTYENVAKVLDNIYACIMLKEEDRSIKSKSKRVTDVIYIIEHDYIDTIKGEPILIDNWENIKKRLEH